MYSFYNFQLLEIAKSFQIKNSKTQVYQLKYLFCKLIFFKSTDFTKANWLGLIAFRNVAPPLNSFGPSENTNCTEFPGIFDFLTICRQYWLQMVGVIDYGIFSVKILDVNTIRIQKFRDWKYFFGMWHIEKIDYFLNSGFFCHLDFTWNQIWRI